MARVFLVDDHPDVREAVGQLLNMHGHTVSFVTSGELAWEKMESEAPEVLISDHRLPGMSGVELLRKVRHDPRYSSVRCILFSADSNIKDLAADAKAHDYWVKGSDALFDSIAQLRT